MDIFIFLVPFTILFSLIGLAALLWAIKSKQYDDIQGAASRILFEDEEKKLD